MRPDSIVLQQASARPAQFILLFHGVGPTPASQLCKVPTARGIHKTPMSFAS